MFNNKKNNWNFELNETKQQQQQNTKQKTRMGGQYGGKRARRDARTKKRLKRRKMLFEVIETDFTCSDDDGGENSTRANLVTLNDNCLESVMEWLSLADLVNLSMTCKRMQMVTSDYFGRKYPTKRMTVKMDTRQRIEYWPREMYVQRFREYFQNIAIRGRQVKKGLCQISRPFHIDQSMGQKINHSFLFKFF